ncbi:MBL fold metallo-hydrolase [Pseudoalteromonas sp. BDTF-M6]|uniref:MBL fold metallo-hydrolase n=1 Tax=Pseudoalteromonas sp. BDTF-M6 TaxID=2796132 RepID=UPI001BB06D67|nr:MBL fold metallo-hydrolase [Pseudoalteromonas sp. BDTF-M6]MBS3797406.1 MBL fold metallo-hydrolase [Pseudoalteromonas sp. BDTF-M6]
MRQYRQCLSALVLCLSATGLQAQQSWQTVSEHVDFIEQPAKLRFYDSNQVLIQGEQCALLVDAPGEFTQTEVFIAHLKEQLRVPLCYMLASHAHDDHLLGLAMVQKHFPDAQLIVHQSLGENFHLAHEQLNERLDGFAKSLALSQQRMESLSELEQQPWREKIARAQARFKQWQALRFSSPGKVISQPNELDLGKLKVELLPFAAHTQGDIAVLVWADKLLVGADMVDTLPYPGEANYQAWLMALEELSHLPVTQVLPGHGGVLATSDLTKPKAWLEAIVAHVKANPSTDVATLVETFPKRYQPQDDELAQRAYAMFLEAGIKRAKQL